jgi:hypothetical protein
MTTPPGKYADGANSKVETFTAERRGEALRRGWVVISSKDDRKRIFPFEK